MHGNEHAKKEVIDNRSIGIGKIIGINNREIGIIGKDKINNMKK